MKPFQKLRECLEKSTPGEWQKGRDDMDSYDGDGVRFKNVYTPDKEDTIKVSTANPHEDGRFIAEAHNTLPKALECLDLAVGALEEIKEHDCETCVNDEMARIALAKIREIAGEK